MSILRPKDGDYISRGLLLLLIWILIGWAPFVLARLLLAGPGGAAVGLIGGLALGIALYGPYISLDPRIRKQKR